MWWWVSPKSRHGFDAPFTLRACMSAGVSHQSKIPWNPRSISVSWLTTHYTTLSWCSTDPLHFSSHMLSLVIRLLQSSPFLGIPISIMSELPGSGAQKLLMFLRMSRQPCQLGWRTGNVRNHTVKQHDFLRRPDVGKRRDCLRWIAHRGWHAIYPYFWQIRAFPDRLFAAIVILCTNWL